MWFIAHRRSHGSVDAELAADKEERVGHIVAVTYKGQLLPLHLPPHLPQRQHIAQSLAGMAKVGQAIDHRYAGV